METIIKSVSIVPTEVGRVVYFQLADEVDYIDPKAGFVHAKRKQLNMSLKQLMHFLNASVTDAGLDACFRIVDCDWNERMFSDLFTDAKISVTQAERTAGEMYTDANGNEQVAVYDSIRVVDFAVNALSQIGQFAADYSGKIEDYENSPARKKLLIAARKAANLAAIKAAQTNAQANAQA